ncbi:MAG TPA: TolC family protein [Rhodocyclaceae bacterium]|jgi:cobalt-zinc-cadmium efflux system outer membrane protein|nr:TolC family protein [Rhodocyclaceae bacterium]
MRTRFSLWPLGLAAFGPFAWAQTPPNDTAPLPSSYISDKAFSARTLESPGHLALSEAIRLALSFNPELAASAREVGAQEGAVIQAGVWRNPELSSIIEDRQPATRTTTYQINQPLEIGGKRGARIDVAERNRDIAAVDLNAQQATIRAGVITAFFDVLAAQERVKIAQSLLELAQNSTLAASRRVTAGRISPVEETKARVAEASVKVDLAQANSDLLNARKQLAAYWGNPAPRFVRADGDAERLPALPPVATLDARFARTPDMRRAQLELERSKSVVDLEKAKRIPDITLSLGSKRDATLDHTQAIVGLSIPIPLFDRNQGNLHEALERRDKAREEFAATQLRLSTNLAQTYEQLKTSRLEAESLRTEILPGAQSAFDAASTGFTLGKFNFLEVLDAQRTLFQAKTQYLKALASAHRAAADLDRLLGTTDGLPR